MALTLNGVDLRGKVAQPAIEEIIFSNNTLKEDAVNVVDEVLSTVIFNEKLVNPQMQAFTSGIPTSAGTQTSFDVPIIPVLTMYHDEFDPTQIRLSSDRQYMKSGFWNYFTENDEFAKRVFGGMYAKKISRDYEVKFWTNARTTTKTTVAGLTAGTAQNQVSTQEQALVAALPTVTGVLFDGIIPYTIYNSSNASLTGAVGGRVKVVGTTITSTNIRDEYIKVYNAIPPVVLNEAPEDLVIYAPMSHRQLINTYNSIPSNFRSGGFSEDGKSFLGIRIVFVPTPENVLLSAKKSHINWVTNLTSDMNEMLLEKVDPRSKLWFVQVVSSIFAHVTNQAYNVLYVG